jgi:hypothetical protein
MEAALGTWVTVGEFVVDCVIATVVAAAVVVEVIVMIARSLPMLTSRSFRAKAPIQRRPRQ